MAELLTAFCFSKDGGSHVVFSQLNSSKEIFCWTFHDVPVFQILSNSVQFRQSYSRFYSVYQKWEFGEKPRKTRQKYFTTLPRRPLFSSFTKFALVSQSRLDEFIKCAKNGFHMFIGVRFMRSHKNELPFK